MEICSLVLYLYIVSFQKHHNTVNTLIHLLLIYVLISFQTTFLLLASIEIIYTFPLNKQIELVKGRKTGSTLSPPFGWCGPF